jgi:hypothetical protein
MCCGDDYKDVGPKPKTVIGWRVWYPLVSYDSRDLAWDQLPDDDVQVVMLYLADGTRSIYSGYDNYFMWNDIPCANNHDADDNARRYPGASVKRGKHMELDAFEQIQKAAMESVWP